MKSVGAVPVALMVMLNALVFTLPPLLLACTVIGPNVPATVGVPEITPAPLKLKPVGNAPETMLYAGAGNPLAARV